MLISVREPDFERDYRRRFPMLSLELVASFMCTLPLALHETNQAAVDNWMSPTGLSWLTAVRAVQPLTDHGAHAGLRLKLEEGEILGLPWNGVRNYAVLADAIEARGL